MILSLLAGCTGVIVLYPNADPETLEPVQPLACEETALDTLTAELSWSVSLSSYGDWGGLHGFSPDGDQLVSAADVYTPHVYTFETADGSHTLAKDDVFPWSRDEDWTIETRGVGWNDAAVVDLTTGDELISEPDVGDLGSGSHSVVSGDGSRVASVDCEHGFTRVDVWSTRTGDRVLDLALPGGCTSSPPGLGQVMLSHDGQTLFSAWPESGSVMRVGVDEGSVDLVGAHAEVEPEVWTTTDFLHTVTLLPGDDVLVTVGSDGWLRQWDAHTLAPIAPDQAAAGTVVNENIYANPATYTPVAGSPDGSLLATLDADGELVIHRACDGQPLVALPFPAHADVPSWSEDPGAVAVAFHPAGDRVAVRYEDVVALWSLSD